MINTIIPTAFDLANIAANLNVDRADREYYRCLIHRDHYIFTNERKAQELDTFEYTQDVILEKDKETGRWKFTGTVWIT